MPVSSSNEQGAKSGRNADGVEFDVTAAALWGTFLQATVALAACENTECYNNSWGFQLLVFKPR